MPTASPAPAAPPTISVLGLPVHDVDMPSALERIDSFIRSGNPHHVVTADASMMVMAHEDPELKTIITNADLVTPDSVGILWAAKRIGRPLRQCVSGVEIVERLCAASPERGYRIYFLGAAPNVAVQAAERMRAKYPGVQIVGAEHGFFTDKDMPALIEQIRAIHPDVICVALGIPKQEKWISAHRHELGATVLIGVGGTLDVLSGKVRRAPGVMRSLRLEWLWRVASNPKKISKVLLLPRFIQLVTSASHASPLS